MYVEDFWELGRVAASLSSVPSVIRHRYHFKPGSKGCAFYIFTGKFRTVACGTLAQLLATFWGRWTRCWGIAWQCLALQWLLDSIQYSESWSSQSSGQYEQAHVNRFTHIAETLPPSCKKSPGCILQREWKNTRQHPWRTVLAKHQRSMNAIWNTLVYFYLSWVDHCHYHLASHPVHEQREPIQQDS